MCRIVAYLGRPALLEDILVAPNNSIKFSDLAEGWEDIPAQHMMLIDENKMIQLRPL